MSTSSGPPAFTIDVVINVLKNTLFSAFFCAFIPVVLASKDRPWIQQPTVCWTAGWAALLLVGAVFKYIGRVYAGGTSYFFLPPKLNWESQIVVITGGGSGIGALLAQTLAMRNVTVVTLDLKFSNESIENVNNAGVVKGKLLLDLTEDDIRGTFGVNTLAHFWTLKAFLPAMLKKSTGHIVSVASVLGIISSAQMTDYCSSKAALLNLHQSLRFELDNRYKTPKIRTTLLLPSFLSTPLFSKIHMPHTMSSLGAFFCPPVAPPTIVKAIISALDNDEGRVIRLPFYSQVARLTGVAVGLMPKWFMDAVQWGSGADWAMRDYGPKPDAAERLAEERKRAA